MMNAEKRPYSTYDITEIEEGKWSVWWETDDDDDCGYPNHIYSEASYIFNSLEKALKFTGKTRRGILQDVTVTINGKIYTGEPINEA